MNLDVALSVVQLKKHKPETKAAVAMAVKNAKCSQLFALLAEKIRWFLFNRLVKNLYIAAGSTSTRGSVQNGIEQLKRRSLDYAGIFCNYDDNITYSNGAFKGVYTETPGDKGNAIW